MCVCYLQVEEVCVCPAVCVSRRHLSVEEFVAESTDEAANRNHEAASCSDIRPGSVWVHHTQRQQAATRGRRAATGGFTVSQLRIELVFFFLRLFGINSL